MSLDVYLKKLMPTEIFNANVTHNLNKMAKYVGLYEALWQPEEIGVIKAEQLIPLLEKGLEKLKADPVGCRKLNPPNGWGDYEGLIQFVENYLEACRENRDSDVDVSK